MPSSAYSRARILAALASLLLLSSVSLTAQTATPAQCVDCHSKVKRSTAIIVVVCWYLLWKLITSGLATLG